MCENLWRACQPHVQTLGPLPPVALLGDGLHTDVLMKSPELPITCSLRRPPARWCQYSLCKLLCGPGTATVSECHLLSLLQELSLTNLCGLCTQKALCLSVHSHSVQVSGLLQKGICHFPMSTEAPAWQHWKLCLFDGQSTPSSVVTHFFQVHP